MATLAEIYGLMTDVELLQRTQSALCIAAENVRDTTPAGVTAEVTRRWVAQVTYNPVGEASKAWRMILGADGDTASEAQILAVTDAQLQNKVNGIVVDMIKMFNQL